MSWSESVVIDNDGSDEERAAARATDTETRWEDLVDDPTWNEEVGVGGFSFLDPIGFAYYLAPAMIRATRSGEGEELVYHLSIDNPWKKNKILSIQSAQARAVARFVRFMVLVHEVAGGKTVGEKIYGEEWQAAFEGHWQRFYG